MKKKTKIMSPIVACFITAVCLTICGAQGAYRPTGVCESDQSCVYRYTSTQRSFDGDQQQVAKVSAVVVSQCSSVGSYGKQASTLYCIKVSRVIVSGDLIKDDSNDEVLDPTEEDIPDLDPNDSILKDPPISPEDKMMTGEFCFVQTDDGKIVEVTYPEGESSEAVNFKKGIVAAFQTNFKGTAQQVEEDTTSLHQSAYRYAQRGKQTVAYRTIQSPNVRAFAGGTPTEDVQVSANEQIVYDGNVLFSSAGKTSVILSAGAGNLGSLQPAPTRLPTQQRGILASVQQYEHADGLLRPRRGVRGARPEQDTYDSRTDIKEFKGEGEYSLVKVSCRAVAKRSVPYSTMDEISSNSKLVTDTLRANINLTLADLQQMEALRSQLPSVWGALEKLHKDAGQMKLADSLHQLISLEGEHKPLQGFKPAVEEVIAYLKKLLGSDKAEDKQMRNIIYSMLNSEGHLEAQTALLESYVRTVDQEEKNSLITHIAFTSNPHPNFVEMIKQAIDTSVTSTDPLLLGYGALASSKVERVQHSVVQELLGRIDRLEKSIKTDKTHAIIHHLHALGNTESQQVIETVLRYLQHPDLDIQLASINALKAHTTDERVQQRIEQILQSATFEDQVEAVVQMLIEALEHLNKERKTLDNRYVNSLASVGFFDDTKLKQLVSYYLQKLGTKEALELLHALNAQDMNSAENEETMYDFRDDVVSEDRVRRGSDWDASSSIYNLVASYSSRRSDVTAHPKHKAYIWGKKFGISKVYAQVAAGGFAGIKPNGAGYKLFAKVIAKGYAFGKSATALRAEFLRRRTGSSIYQKIYAKVVGKTLINQAGTLSAGCNSITKNLYSANLRIFRFKFSIFIYVGTLDFYIGMYAKLGLKLKASVCETTVKACASLIPSLTLRAEGGARATILLVVRGGIEVAASFTYQLEPEICIHYCKNAPTKVKACVNVYHGWPNNYAEIYAYYQLRKIKLFPPKFKWGSKKRWSKLSKRWNLPSLSRRRIWGSCDPNPVCPSPPPTVRPPIFIRPPIKIRPIGPIGRPGFQGPQRIALP